MAGGGGAVDPGTIRERYKDTPVFESFEDLERADGTSAVSRMGSARVGDEIYDFVGGDSGLWEVSRTFPSGTFSGGAAGGGTAAGGAAGGGAAPAPGGGVASGGPLASALPYGPYLLPESRFGAGDVAPVDAGLLAPGMTEAMYSPWSDKYWEASLPESAGMAMYAYPDISYPSSLGYMTPPPGGVDWAAAAAAGTRPGTRPGAGPGSGPGAGPGSGPEPGDEGGHDPEGGPTAWGTGTTHVTEFGDYSVMDDGTVAVSGGWADTGDPGAGHTSPGGAPAGGHHSDDHTGDEPGHAVSWGGHDATAEEAAGTADYGDAGDSDSGAEDSPGAGHGMGHDDGGEDSGGGGGGGPCLIATHGVMTGGFTMMEKIKAELWCAKKYHGKWYGEAFRRGYRAAGQKHIDAGTAESVYQEFKDFVAYGRGLKKGFRIGLSYYWRTLSFFVNGLFLRGSK